RASVRSAMRTLWICLAALAALLAMACAADTSRPVAAPASSPRQTLRGEDPAASDVPPVSPTHVRVAYAVVDGMIAPLWLALDAGLWQRHGLDVELSLISGTPNAMAALVADEVQFVQTAGDSALPVQAREPNIVGLLNPATASPHRLIVAPD